MANISALIRKRTDLKSRLTRFENYLVTLSESSDVNELNVKLDFLEEKFKGFYQTYDELPELDEDAQEDHSNTLFNMEEHFCLLKTKAKNFIRTSEQPSLLTATSTMVQPNSMPVANLPEIKLPKFDGNIENWRGFRDIFIAKIGSNLRISSVDKMFYLKSYLTGKAARSIEAMECTEENYEEAWNILSNKYNNTRKAILRHWSILYEYPPLQRDAPEALDELADLFRQHIRCLKGLGEPVEHFNSVFIFLISKKINTHTRIQWESTLNDNKIPHVDSILEFLEKRGGCSDSSSRDKKQINQRVHHESGRKEETKGKIRAHNFFSKSIKKSNQLCPICKKVHLIYHCGIFRNMSYEKRKEAIAQAKLCYNCLKIGHQADDCLGKTCAICNVKHNTFLHQPDNASTKDHETSSSGRENSEIQIVTQNVKSFLLDSKVYNEVIPTAWLDILNSENMPLATRAIIDTGSTKNFITEDLATRLRLPKNMIRTTIGALGGISTVSRHRVQATIKSKYNNYQKTLEFLVVPTITSSIPEKQIDRNSFNIPRNIQLADPQFHTPAPVHLLLGCGPSLSSLSIGQIRLSSSEEPDLILQKSQLGWIVGGSWTVFNNVISENKCYFLNNSVDISKFWEIEEGSTDKQISLEEENCEKHFRRHVSRQLNGRYIVALPFNHKRDQLGESYVTALKRLRSLERRFLKDPDLKENYSAVINEYVQRGYISKLNKNPPKGHFLPHQAVIKETSLTTKVRVVFDGSATSSSGISLNDVLMTGPNIQEDIFSLLLRFRLYKYVLTGDIEKMYHQIVIREEDRPYLLFLWREKDASVATYQFNRLVFGLKPASFLATRCLHQLADDERTKYPIATQVLKRDLYVDDLLTGANTVQEVITLQKDLSELLAKGGFQLRQCASNSTQVLKTIPNMDVNLKLQESATCTLKTLGVHWNSKQDAIIYTVPPIEESYVTKRTIFSEIAKIFDPLGVLSPVIVLAKLLIQDIWKLKIDWDESLPANIYTRWIKFMSQLPKLNGLLFERNVLQLNTKKVQLHGFCDASEKAYGACIYVRTIDSSHNIHVVLYCAKSRVAPIKNAQTIPRLELCAASLLADLYDKVRNSINILEYDTLFWTDSTIVLHWINTSPRLLKIFVANRVSNIQRKTDLLNWRYVSTLDNPADLLSRGRMPQDFLGVTLWRRGPSWLCRGENEWPQQPLLKSKEVFEPRNATCLKSFCVDQSIIQRYSSFTRLQRIVAYILRFKVSNHNKGWITSIELQLATNIILKVIQNINFQEEISTLQRGDNLFTRSKLLPLNPFLDGNGLLRVGGRLQNSEYSYKYKHPILLPKSCHVTKLLIRHYHNITLHGGNQATLYAIRQQYWIIDGRNQVRQVIRLCLTCARLRPSSVDYKMGNLPRVRTIQTRPFYNVGIDYCGPFFIKEKKLRNRNRIKIYVAVMICMSTKAVHLEMISELTTEGFMSVLKRFISRRGLCASIYSDNASYFVGANNELHDLQSLLLSKEHNEKMQMYLANQGISWRFSPPYSPHFGGIWEAAVKSFKYHLRRVVGLTLLTYEQFNTFVIEIEAILNSRPLTPMSSDPNDIVALTPAHFLIGDSLLSLPECDLTKVQDNRLSLWQHIQKMKQDFWKRWHKEYLNELNIRRKWCSGNHDIQEGSMVLIRDNKLPPLQWRLGRVIQIQPGQDGTTRTVVLRTVRGDIQRGVKYLTPLPNV